MSVDRRGPRTAAQLAIAALIAAAVLVTYRDVAGFDFIRFDDPLYVTENSHVREGLSVDGLLWALGAVGYAGNWHPLTWASHMLDVELFGLAPGRHHLSSVVLHAINAMLLFFALTRLLAAQSAVRSAREIAAMSAAVAAAFALHPLRMESVVWISERKDLLSATFWFAGLWAYARWARRPGPGRYLVVALCLALGLAAKPMLVTFPLALLLIDHWPLGRIRLERAGSLRRAVVEKIPLFVLCGASAIVTLIAQQRGGAVSAAEALPVGVRFGNALVAYGAYVRDLFVPWNLSIVYPFPLDGVSASMLALALAAFAALTASALLCIRARPWIFTGWLWFVVTLLPVVGLIQVGQQARADRYTYIPHVGLLLALAVVAATWASHRRRGVAIAVLGAAVLACGGLGVLTARQIGHWENTETLFTHALEVTDGNYVAHAVLAAECAGRGDAEAAERHYRSALSAHPGYVKARVRLARLLVDRGALAEAAEHLNAAMQTAPNDAETRYEAGHLYLTTGAFERAIEEFRRSLALDPARAEAHNDLGVALERTGDVDGALSSYRTAMRYRPDLVEAYINLASALGRMRRHQEAIEVARQAVVLAPDDPSARYALGVLYLLAGDREAAAKAVEALRPIDTERAERLKAALER